MQYRVGIDIGGTFTDFVAFNEAKRELTAWKNLSTPRDPIEGVMTGLKAFGDTNEIASIRLGTTVATNALLEAKGAVVGYVTTRGFRDVPFIGRGNRRNHYDLAWVKPKPFVKRHNAFEVNERIGASGAIIEKLDEAQVRALADSIVAAGEIEAIAVVLMHSYLAPEHEFLIKKIFAERAPKIPVSISYEVLPKWKEHFRSSTTICDAFIKPVVNRQLRSILSLTHWR
jgi:N-methylhydantoinase A